MTTIPFSALLGYAGALVFLALAIGVSKGSIPISAFYVYTIMILSFIAGTHWDKFDDTKRWRSLTSALGVTMVIFVYIFIDLETSLLASVGLFCLYLLFDFKDYQVNSIVRHYFLFRAIASLCAVGSSVYLLFSKGV